MTSPSADRPLLHPEKIQTFTDEDVRLVAKAIGADYWIPSDRSAAARDVLAALAAAGRLLPPSAEHREEWGLWLSGSPSVPAGVAWDQIFDSEEEAREQAAFLLGVGWTVARPVRRNVWAGPWVEVDRSPLRCLTSWTSPVEVTLIDGSRWLIYYRIAGGFADAIKWVSKDIDARCIRPADDLDGVQRRLAQINMAYVVSFREPTSTRRRERSHP